MERAGHEFMERVRDGYLEMARTDERVERVDAAGGLKDVQERVRTVLCTRFPKRLALKALEGDVHEAE
jgi:thymidylate kinase